MSTVVGSVHFLTEADFFPLSVLVDTAVGDRDMNMGIPVESYG
jgi:hypothetical protein